MLGETTRDSGKDRRRAFLKYKQHLCGRKRSACLQALFFIIIRFFFSPENNFSSDSTFGPDLVVVQQALKSFYCSFYVIDWKCSFLVQASCGKPTFSSIECIKMANNRHNLAVKSNNSGSLDHIACFPVVMEM